MLLNIKFTVSINCFQDAQLVEALWKGDLDYELSEITEDSLGVSPFGADTNEGSFLLPGDEPPSRNHTFSSSPSSPNRRWHLLPLNFNSTDLSVGTSLYPVNCPSLFLCQINNIFIHIFMYIFSTEPI